MGRTSARRLALSAAALCLAGGLACGSGSAAFVDPFPGSERIAVPDRLGELDVVLEKDATKELGAVSTERTYVDEGWVYGLRLADELKAIYQVIRLTADARPQDLEFRRDVLGQIGGTLERPERIDSTLVYEGSSGEQRMFMWFEGRYLQVLIIRDEETVQGEGLGFSVEALKAEVVALRPA